MTATTIGYTNGRLNLLNAATGSDNPSSNFLKYPVSAGFLFSIFTNLQQINSQE